MALDSETLAQLCATLRRFVDEQLIPAEAEVSEVMRSRNGSSRKCARSACSA